MFHLTLGQVPNKQMRILGIDYGRKKIGLAIAEGYLAEPYCVIRFNLEKEALEKVSAAFARVSKDKKVELIVVGVSEGQMGREQKNFGKKLKDTLKTPVIFQDETLTTQDAQKLSQNAQIKRKKRQNLEDAYSATLILQSFLDL